MFSKVDLNLVAFFSFMSVSLSPCVSVFARIELTASLAHSTHTPSDSLVVFFRTQRPYTAADKMKWHMKSASRSVCEALMCHPVVFVFRLADSQIAIQCC